MKRIIFGISVVFLLLGSTYVLAQMDDGVKAGKNGESARDHDDEAYHSVVADYAESITHGEMMDGLTGLSAQMSEMMSKMTVMLKDMPEDKRESMSGVMEGMSHEMMRMSRAIGRGKLSEKGLKQLQEHMTEMQEHIGKMETHK